MKHRSLRFQVGLACWLIGGVLLVAPFGARALVIDDFTQGALAPIQATNTAQYGNTVVQSGLNPAQVLGGTRSVFVGSLTLATASIETIKGRFNFSANNNFGYFKLGWGTVTPLNADLSGGGNNRFQFDFVDVLPTASLNLFNLRVKSGNSWFNYEIGNDFAAAMEGKTYGTLNVPFAKFGGANFTQVQAIELEAARTPSGFHLTIESITAVPEPSAAALLGIAIGAGLLGRRSLRTAAISPITSPSTAMAIHHNDENKSYQVIQFTADTVAAGK